jgi:flagellar basal body P-ring protein FlgI
VVEAGETGVVVPVAATEPMPWSMLAETAFAVASVSVEESPGSIVFGIAVSVQEGDVTTGGVTVTVVEQCFVSPLPVTVAV